MKRMMVVVGLAGCMAAAGCGKKTDEMLAEKLIEKGLSKDGVRAKVDLAGEAMSFTTTDADGKPAFVTMSGDTLVIEGPDGVETFRAGGVGEMPKNFPADVYVQAGASVVSSLSAGGGFNLSLQTPRPKADVVATYAAEMPAKGWTSKTTMDMGETAMLTFAKDNRMATVIIQAEGGATSIILTVGAN